MMNLLRGMLGAGLVAIALSIFAMPSQSAYAMECREPKQCGDECKLMAIRNNVKDEEFDSYVNTCKFVNCGEGGYFIGAQDAYEMCLDKKAVEDAAKKKQEEELKKKAEEKRVQERDKKRSAEDKKGKPFLTKMAYNKDVKAGETIKAGKNETVVIDYADGSRFVLEPGSSMKIHSDYYVYLSRGKLELVLKRLKVQVGRKFEVRTGAASGGVRGTHFRVETKGVSTTFIVFEGVVDVSNLKGDKTVEVNAGYSVVARKNGKISQPKAFDPEKIKAWDEVGTEAIK